MDRSLCLIDNTFEEDTVAETPSTLLALGTPAVDFRLADPSGRESSLAGSASSPGLVIMFIS
ncbi:MAG: hypothetical protein JW940_28940 [Polyangiaceae bacterium]|nr:hypothetical protein [Polyangiaceae bacterium]